MIKMINRWGTHVLDPNMALPVITLHDLDLV